MSAHAQNVGVGNTNPHTKLEVTGGISSTPVSAPAATAVTIPNNVGEYHETDPPFIIEADPGLIIEIDPPLIM